MILSNPNDPMSVARYIFRPSNREAVDEVAALVAALQGLQNSGILGSAESNASGNPEWEFVSVRINAARSALVRIGAK